MAGSAAGSGERLRRYIRPAATLGPMVAMDDVCASPPAQTGPGDFEFRVSLANDVLPDPVISDIASSNLTVLFATFARWRILLIPGPPDGKRVAETRLSATFSMAPIRKNAGPF